MLTYLIGGTRRAAQLAGRTWAEVRRRTVDREFSFRDQWRVPASVDEVAQLLFDTANIPRWWPQTASVIVADFGAGAGENRTGSSRLQGFLPYVLDVTFRVVDVHYPNSYRLELGGDLQGRGGADIRRDGAETTVDFHLTIQVVKPVLRLLAFTSTPLLHCQHTWVMRQGERGLKRALANPTVRPAP